MSFANRNWFSTLCYRKSGNCENILIFTNNCIYQFKNEKCRAQKKGSPKSSPRLIITHKISSIVCDISERVLNVYKRWSIESNPEKKAQQPNKMFNKMNIIAYAYVYIFRYISSGWKNTTTSAELIFYNAVVVPIY